MEIIILALISSLGMVFMMYKIFGMFSIKYDWIFDIFFTIIIPILFVGTFSGMVLAMLTGIFISVELFILKKLLMKAGKLPS